MVQSQSLVLAQWQMTLAKRQDALISGVSISAWAAFRAAPSWGFVPDPERGHPHFGA
jgi:hypothetical protein